MKCVFCGKEIEENMQICPNCGKPAKMCDLTYDETRELSRNLHDTVNKSNESFDSGMVGIVLGSTFLIIGILFFILSYKVPDDPDTIGKVLKFTCFEFWVSMAGLVAGGALFIYGVIRIILALTKKSNALKNLKSLQAIEDELKAKSKAETAAE